MNRFITLLVFVFSFSSCSLLDDISDVEDVTIAPEVILPLVNINLNTNDLIEIPVVSGIAQFDVTELDVINEAWLNQLGTNTVAPFNESDFELIDLTDEFEVDEIGPIESALVDFQASVTIENFFDIPIGAGTRFELLNNAGEVVVDVDVPEDIAPDGIITINKNVEGANFDGLVLNIASFQSPGGDVTLTDANRNINISYNLSLSEVDQVAFTFDSDYIFQDTSDFEVLEDEEIDIFGGLNAITTNNTLLGGEITITLLSPNGLAPFELTRYAIVPGTQTSNSVSPSVSNELVANINQEILDRLRDADLIMVTLNLPSTQSIIELTTDSNIDIRLTVNGTVETTL